MDEERFNALVDGFEEITGVMIAGLEAEFKKVGAAKAILEFELQLVRHHAKNGTWDEAPDLERPAHMLWAAAELFVGALINAGVWHDEL